MKRSLVIALCSTALVGAVALLYYEGMPTTEDAKIARASTPLPESAKGDLVESLRESLTAESAAKDVLAKQLEDRSSALASEKQRSEKLEQEKFRLEGEQERLERLRRQLESERDKLAGLVQMSQQDRDSLRDAVAAAQARVKQAEDQLAAREKELRDARTEIDSLREVVNSARRERDVMAAKLDAAQRECERLESVAGTLRAESDRNARMVENMRQNRVMTPLSINAIFDNFRRNRAVLHFASRESALFGGEKDSAYQRYTVFVRDGAGRVAALFETGATPFESSSLGQIKGVRAQIELPGHHTEFFSRVAFLKTDPRIAAFSGDKVLAAGGPTVFEIEDNPLRFATAVVVTAGGERYGESPIRVVAGTARYIEVQASLANTLFGSFSPQAGDLVFSMNGNLIGFMVGDGRAICLSSLSQGVSMDLGDSFDAGRVAEVAKKLADETAKAEQAQGR